MAEPVAEAVEERLQPANLEIVESPVSVPAARYQTTDVALRLLGWAVLTALPAIAVTFGIAAVFEAVAWDVYRPGASPFPKLLVGAILAVPSGLFLGAAICGLVALCRMAFGFERPRPLRVIEMLVAMLIGGAAALVGAVLTFIAISGLSRGRQLRRFGRIQLPAVTQGDAWAALPLRPAPEPLLRAALAAQWRENGRTEHASIAAFAKLTLELVALGAPPALIAAAQRDALDELRHAELCFSLARGLDGAAESPGPFPAALRTSSLPLPRTALLVRLAVDSLIDGALHEGVSARVIARLAKRCEDSATRDVLRELAADEGRHAAHGWDVVEWCIAEGGAPVIDALRGAVRALPDEIRSQLPEAARGGAWERWGIHGGALEATEYARAKEDLARRVLRLSPARAA